MTDDPVAYLKAHIDKTQQALEADLARLTRELNDGVTSLRPGEEQRRIEKDLRGLADYREAIDYYEEAAARDANGRDAAFALAMIRILAATQVQLDELRASEMPDHLR